MFLLRVVTACHVTHGSRVLARQRWQILNRLVLTVAFAAAAVISWGACTCLTCPGDRCGSCTVAKAKSSDGEGDCCGGKAAPSAHDEPPASDAPVFAAPHPSGSKCQCRHEAQAYTLTVRPSDQPEKAAGPCAASVCHAGTKLASVAPQGCEFGGGPLVLPRSISSFLSHCALLL